MLFSPPAPCEHTEARVELAKTAGSHYGQRRCARCDKFLGFVMRPESQQLRAEILAKVNELWNASPSPQDRAFMLRVTEADGRLSPRDEARLNGLWARHIVEGEIGRGIRGERTPGMR